jgi:nucleoside-diphosphate-sugar epimerase
MKKALITGGAGFIGLSLARALVDDAIEVDLLDNFSRGKDDRELAVLLSRPGVRFIELDLSVPGATDGLSDRYDVIFHFAAVLGVANVLARAFETLVLNAKLTIEALSLARRQKELSAFLFASTSEVYAGSVLLDIARFPTSEDCPIALPELAKPRTSYMLSKLYGEALVRQSDVPTVIIRPHNVYGPRMGSEHVVPELTERLVRAVPGSEVPVFSPTHTRTFCYIDDAVELIKRLVFNPGAVGKVWNVGTEYPEYRILEVAELLQKMVGTGVKLIPAGDTPGSPSRRCPSMNRTNSLTGYHRRMSLEAGVARTYDWYAKNVFALTPARARS